ncbi:hypothetical protein AX016_1829 [Cellulophaga sp. RHA19]|uniref:hypothetical protein n=1 Tax=Cellulophaga sp. RHA19 TaxID=1798237 RepID=UPI000C2B8B36|nr:hypothetical protein [Cellulophaga sp. RHA19]PKB43625.1 hypothetical protein AX016_1829 [Cellulophaga sp. RHA19]
MKKNGILILLGVIIMGCSPKIRNTISNSTFKPLDSKSEIIVLDSTESILGSMLIGTFKIGDSGFTSDCGYNKVINDAKAQARKFGGNIIQITELKRPKKWGSTCYRIKGNILRNFDEKVISELKSISKKNNKSRLPKGADYAKVYIYRPKMITGSFIGYKVRMDTDSIVCRARNGEKCELKIYDFGKHTFWAKTESTDSVTIDIKKGKEYFIRCAMNPGFITAKPYLNEIESHIAIEELEKMDK